jgi:hypothetical protein
MLRKLPLLEIAALPSMNIIPTYILVYALIYEYCMFVALGFSSYVLYAVELYSLTKVQLISTAIFEALNDDRIGRNMYCTCLQARR